jgi:hypothetical protein
MLTETKTLDRVRAEHLSDCVRELLGLCPEEEIKLTVGPVESPQRNWLLDVAGSWQGPETADELIELIYSARTHSTRVVDLETP